ncbi:MAG: acetylglutamate kinase [bacterium]
MNTSLEKAEVLVEALPYIREFYGKTVVIKYGGNAMTCDELKRKVLLDIVLMKYVGMNPVVVHGGGPMVSQTMEKMGKKPQFVDGLRVTDAETMEIAEMVLAGKLNKELVSFLNQHGGKAVGISGKDGNLLIAEKKVSPKGDLGFVGDVTEINPELVEVLIAKDFIPIICSIGVGKNGESYNINADYVAGKLAAVLKADKLVMMTDVQGIFQDYNDKDSLISTLPRKQAELMIAKGQIAGGMIPKVESCLTAVSGGVKKAHIIDGRMDHSLLLEIFTHQGIGTQVLE